MNMAFLLDRCRYDMTVVDVLTTSVDTDNMTKEKIEFQGIGKTLV